MMDIYLDDPTAGDLTLERDTGLVYRRVGEDRESCGFIGDEDACPPDCADAWVELYAWWVEAGETAKAEYRDATFAYYLGINPAHWN